MFRGSKIAILIAAVALVVLVAPQHAFAQYYADEGGQPALLSSSTTTTTALVVGGVVLTVVLVLPDDDATAMESYLRHNATALAHDVSVGAGATVDDLAAAFGVPAEARGTFGAVLRQHRDTLLPLADPSRLDEDRARTFARTVWRAMAADERLTRYLVRVEAT